jgi:phosphoenolpyruvate-protein kinase (PTS system EI component)
MANLNFARNAITALAAGAQGIGLYRTEFEFMVANRLLTEQEQFVRYRKVVIAMMGLPVTIRLIDIAADKSPEILSSFGGNIDPSCCGAQFLLSRPGLFKTQARAIARAAAFGPVRVLYPMVTDAAQFLCLKKAFCNAAADKSLPALLHGAMIEQPSAVDDAGRIFESADFACLGTNDLTKHLLHVDRDTAIAHGCGSGEIIQALGGHRPVWHRWHRPTVKHLRYAVKWHRMCICSPVSRNSE